MTHGIYALRYVSGIAPSRIAHRIANSPSPRPLEDGTTGSGGTCKPARGCRPSRALRPCAASMVPRVTPRARCGVVAQQGRRGGGWRTVSHVPYSIDRTALGLIQHQVSRIGRRPVLIQAEHVVDEHGPRCGILKAHITKNCERHWRLVAHGQGAKIASHISALYAVHILRAWQQAIDDDMVVPPTIL